MNAFGVVREFEKRVAEFTGAPYAVAVNTGTSALFLSLVYCRERYGEQLVTLPARTFVSVPMAVLQSGHRLTFLDYQWEGVYTLQPFEIIDSALRFHKGMYRGGLQCLSFQARKLLNIGEGGMVLTDDEEAAEWLRKACYCGRGGPDYRVEDIASMGWNLYMTPEKAARGLHLMEYLAPYLPDQKMTYPDLREVKFFNERLSSGKQLRAA